MNSNFSYPKNILPIQESKMNKLSNNELTKLLIECSKFGDGDSEIDVSPETYKLFETDKDQAIKKVEEAQRQLDELFSKNKSELKK